MGTPMKPDPLKYCEHCGTQLHRARYGKKLESPQRFLKRRFCSYACTHAAQVKTEAGDSALHKRAQEFKRSACDQCGDTQLLNVHHQDGNPANNTADNCVTLCAACHTKWHWEHGKTVPKRTPQLCIVCGAAPRPGGHLRRGMCNAHYKRWLADRQTALALSVGA